MLNLKEVDPTREQLEQQMWGKSDTLNQHSDLVIENRLDAIEKEYGLDYIIDYYVKNYYKLEDASDVKMGFLIVIEKRLDERQIDLSGHIKLYGDRKELAATYKRLRIAAARYKRLSPYTRAKLDILNGMFGDK